MFDESNPSTTASPLFLAADNHNLASEGESWYSSPFKFIGVSAISGLNSFVETGAAVANFFGADVKAKQTSEVLASLDDDLAQYYLRHKEGADLLGFMATSIIPGLGGIKALHAGQKFVAGTSFLESASSTGWIGRNAETLTGLLAPKADRFIFAARNEIEAANTAYKLTSNNVLKAVGTNAWQNVLEGAAFETAVQATMFKSPVLEDQDAGAIAYSVLVGGLAGGVLGGAFGAAKIVGELKGYRELSDVAKGPFRQGTQYATASLESEKIILSAEHRDTALEVKNLLTEDIINDAKLTPAQRETLIASRTKSASALEADRTMQMNNQIRENINAMARNDNLVGNLVADEAILKNKQEIAQLFAYSKDITRQGESSFATREASERISKQGKDAFVGDLQHRTIALWGDDAGTIYTSVPSYRPAEMLRDAGEIDKYVLKTVQGFKNFAGALTEKLTARQAEAAWMFGRTQVGLKDFSAKVISLSPESVHSMDAFLRILQNAKDPVEILTKKTVMVGDVRISDVNQLMEQVRAAKETLVGKLLLKREEKGIDKITDEMIGSIADVTPAFVRGSREAKDFWAHDARQAALDELRKAKRSSNLPESADYVPRYAKISYQLPTEDAGNGLTKLKNLTPESGLSDAIAAQKLYKERVKAASKFMGVEGEPDIPLDVMLGAGSGGAGPGMFGFSAGQLGKAAAYTEAIGARITKPLIEKYQKEVVDRFTAPLFAMRNDAEASAEWAMANKFLGSQKGAYSLYEDVLVPQKIAAQLREAKTPAEIDDILAEVTDPIFQIKSPKTREVIQNLQEQNKLNRVRYETCAHARGDMQALDPEVVPVIRPDPKSHPFIALVDTGKLIDGGQKSMLFARTEKELQELIAKTRAIDPGIEVRTPSQAEAWYKARNEYDYQQTIHETYTSSQFAQEGIYNSLYLQTDPAAMIDNILAHFNRQATSMARLAVETRYDVEFSFWKKQGQIYTDTALSRLPRISGKKAEAEVVNPFTDLVKTALNISRKSEYPIWNSVNEKAEQMVSMTADKVKSFGFQDYSKLEEVNAAYKRLGVQPALGDALKSLQDNGSLILVGEDSKLVNASVTKGALSEFVSKSHGILSLMTLGLDAVNAVVNTLGATILRTTEIRHLLQAINESNPEIAGKLAGVKVPGTTDSMMATPKLIANAIREFVREPEIKKRVIQEWNLDAGVLRNHDEIIEQLTLRAGETDQSLFARPKAAYRKLQELGPKWTGNQLAETFNRFVTIRSVEQITDEAVKLGKITQEEAKVYINTVLNRVEGNTTASQRPILFQGPIGAAIGLFQGYQFNMIQQLLRYVKDGSAKDAAMLLGLQGTMFGMNSMPAFQIINQHLVGNAPGNKNHTDLYDMTKKIGGEEIGDFLLYGMPSNLIGAGIYSRGDINPRNITIVPNSIDETPIYGAYSRFFGTIKDVYTKISGGVPVWNSMLYGLEHQGLVRPLAGLAQVLQGYSTSGQGSLIKANDLMSWASVTRLAGSKPFEEAKIRDALFRYDSYELHDGAKLKELSTNAKLANLSGNVDYAAFAQAYADLGGNQSSFNKWMINQYKAATVPQAQQIAEQMKKPMAQKIQLMMDS